MRRCVSRLFSWMASTFVHVSHIRAPRRSQLTSTPDSQGPYGADHSPSLLQQRDQGNPVVLPACNFCPGHIPDKVPARGGKGSAVDLEHMYSSVLGALQCRICMSAADATDTDAAAGKPVVPLAGSS